MYELEHSQALPRPEPATSFMYPFSGDSMELTLTDEHIKSDIDKLRIRASAIDA